MERDASSTAYLAELYASHQPRLLRRIRRQLPCLQDAEDVTAETFAQVVQMPDARQIAEPEAFLTTIARRLAMRLWRRRRVENVYLSRLQTMPEHTCPSAEEQLMAIQALQQLDAWMHRLPIPVRMAFLLRMLDGLDHETIARRLGVSVRTVGRYLQQATLCCIAAGRGQAPDQATNT
ncbi:sigma-70 family RNA polymerase sigma factor [Candidimonas humi]|jgi:RNA polymerase sigma-70 factor (ECF subfamily)|uniref:Sigma-70 family RNA polymerase sigma factor n=1 Tax=Candidimonas humi TaxID=683355 RepID=A0ABV8NUK4_9BURK|nr:sigma-70 family RNA polymerase sigma factor [Candidimonas humi]MBV6303644.1 sigma-70 family RNA polymerase sigma factor [Candidimonas humi]